MTTATIKKEVWPDLPLVNWQETYLLVHLLTQMVGKIKLQFVPFKNHWWNISFLPAVYGFTTGIIPFDKGCFEMSIDFISHRIIIMLDDGTSEVIELRSGTISSYYEEIKEKLKRSGITIDIWPVPVEMDYKIPFFSDNTYRKYDREYIGRLHTIFIQVTRVLEAFRTGFSGKASPVHFFWGSFDMAVTLFSGKPAPEHPGAPNVGKKVMTEAYNAELASFGFWPGMGLGEPAFYAYAYPEPAGYRDFKMEVEGARYHETIKEFILPYSAVLSADNPEDKALKFFVSAYQASKKYGNWDEKLCKY